MTNFKYFLLLFLICTACVSNQSKNSNFIKITGDIQNLKDSTLVILNKNFGKKIDTLYALKEKFSFVLQANDSIDNEGLFFLTFKTKNGEKITRIDFWVEKKNLTVKGNFNDKNIVSIENSYVNNILNSYRNVPIKYSKKLDDLFASDKNQKQKDLLFNLYLDSIQTDQINFLFKNPNTTFSLDELFRFKNYISKDSLLIFYNSLNKNLKKSSNGLLLEKQILTKRIKIGEMFENFEAKNLEGKVVKLSDFKGKIVLLDFWAYWCKICHVQNKEEFSYLNQKYKDNLIIISYSLDEDKNVWKKSTEKDSYKWVNLSNLKGMKDPLTYQYGVSALPHSFLINKDGRIINEFIGYKRDSIIEKEIKKLLN